MGQIAVARCSDALVIAELHAATVSVAYREFFPDSPPPTAASLAEVWASRLTDPTAVALVATRDGRPVGSVLTRADPDFPEGQLAGLHVLRRNGAMASAARCTMPRSPNSPPSATQPRGCG